MIIGIEAERANSPQKTGVEHYAKQLILHLAAIDSKNFYILYLRTSPQKWFLNLPSNFKVKVMPFPLFWTQLRISWEMIFHPVDVLLIPASALPLIHPKNSVVTVHDLAWKFYPDTFTNFNRKFLNWSTGFAARGAKSVIAVSEATKKDLIKFYKINPNKTTVVHHGYEETNLLQPAVDDGVLNLPKHFILFLSTLQPRKNLEGLLEAFAELKKEMPELPHKLVVVGKPGWKYEPILAALEKHKDIAVYLNHVPDNIRHIILQRASVLVLPSFYEGFGMQILESFAAGVPVATSKVSSMPEVGGDAAVYFDPKNISDIKNTIKALLLDQSARDQLKARGFERLKSFSWEKCAKETLEVLTR